MRYLKKKLKKILFNQKDILYPIGNYNIWLPFNHTLPLNQARYKNYDKKLKSIITNIEKFDGIGYIIDIGANVGDTAAYIRSFSSAFIFCVEGDVFFLNYLNRNIKLLSDIKVIDSYISGRDTSSSYMVHRIGGTANLKISNDENDFLKMISLSELIHQIGTDKGKINLIKIDTDGFDFDIILANMQIFEYLKPSIYFEYDISLNENSFSESLELIIFLEKIGYKFIIYDNYGNLIDSIYNRCQEKFLKINQYMKSSQIYGGGIFYFDVFASTNEDIINSIVNEEYSIRIS